ncbi:unnamed protein product, partial [Lactuca saligna]
DFLSRFSSFGEWLGWDSGDRISCRCRNFIIVD